MPKFIYVGDDPKFVFNGEYEAEYHLAEDTYSIVIEGVTNEWQGFDFHNEFTEIKPKGTTVTESAKLFASPPTPAPYTKHDLLDEAKAATADRGLNYGKPEDNFARIAAHWNAFLFNRGIIPPTGGGLVSPSDVAIMCALLKIARLENTPNHKDSWIDIAGYAACGAEIELSK